VAQQPHVDLAGTNFPSPSQSTGSLFIVQSPDPIQPELFPHPYLRRPREFPWPVGPAATPCATALPPGSPKCAGGWPPHARCARVRVLASLPHPTHQLPTPPGRRPLQLPAPIHPATLHRRRPRTIRLGIKIRRGRSRYPRRKERSFLDLNLCGRLGVWIKAWFFVRAWFRWYGAGRVVEGGLVS